MSPVIVQTRYSVDAPIETAEQRYRRQRQIEDAVFKLTQEGWTHACQGREDEAEKCYRRAHALGPAQYVKLVALQDRAAGDYERAWTILAQECTTGVNWFGSWRPPRWDGRPLEGTLLVFPDDGFGDQLLYARFLRNLKARGVGRVVMMVSKPLARLLRRVPGVDDVFETGMHTLQPVTAIFPGQPDAWTNMAALPHLLGLNTMAKVPSAPYISADPADVERWRGRVPQEGVRVGLLWRTAPNARGAHRRSFPLATLAPLWQVPGVHFVSLQKGDGEDEAGASPLPLTHLGSDVGDFDDTAAIISLLDVVIGPDVGAMNLAGAMGMPAWVLTDPLPDFRWRHRCWYPSGRVFSQTTERDWREPVEAAAQALEALAQARGVPYERR